MPEQVGDSAGRIVVGVDGSEGSVAALRWAYEEAHLRSATLYVVHAWHYPYVGDMAGMAAYAIPHEELEQNAREVLHRAIEQAGPQPDGVHVEPILAHGGAAGVLLGSVSQQCAHHTPCSVVIVPGTRTTA